MKLIKTVNTVNSIFIMTKMFKTITVAFILILFLVSCSGAYAEVFDANGQIVDSDDVAALLSQATPQDNQYLYFYSATCGSCAKAKEWLNTFHERHPDIVLEYHDVALTETKVLLEEYRAKFNMRFPSVPIIFVGNVAVLEGPDTISTYFEPLSVGISEIAQASTPITSPTVVTPVPTVSPGENSISLWLIIGAGLLDGINPCAFAVLVFLMIYLMSNDSRRKMLIGGLTYSAAVFIFYYLAGVGLFTVVQFAGISYYFSKFAGILSLLFGLVMIKDVIFPSEGPTLAIPESRKEGINKWIKKATLPAAFVLGILVGMFELPCTGGIYLAILSMIALQTDLMGGLFYLLIYNLGFIAPLFIILGAVYYGMPPEKVNEWRLEKRLGLRFIIGLIMIALGIVILTGILH